MLLLWALSGAGFMSPATSSAACLESQQSRVVRQMSPDCTKQERAARPVNGKDLLAAWRSDAAVDLGGVVVTGPVDLDTLPVRSVASLTRLSDDERVRLAALGIVETRYIDGPVTIKDSTVGGSIQTNLGDGYLVVRGPVVLTGTTFERTFDLSRTIFLNVVDLSDVTLIDAAYFIGAQFAKPVSFVNTSFGTHTRFHRASFLKHVSFERARFAGPAEFMEINFKEEADFARSTFSKGTGFSGSRFHAGATFAEAEFGREAYFLFAVFEGAAVFRATQWESVADFSDAVFQGDKDFSHATFTRAPEFSRVNAPPIIPRPIGGGEIFTRHGVTILLLVGAALLVVYVIIMK